jgi:pilus assembly protein CpaC
MQKQIGRIGLAAVTLLAGLGTGWGSPLKTETDEIRVTLGKSLVIDYPEDISRISTSDPGILDYVPVSTREVLLHGKAVGVVTMVVWAKSGQRNLFTVNVELNLEPIRKLLRETFPDEPIVLGVAKDSVSLNGRVSTQQVAERAEKLVAPLAKAVVNNLSVRTAPVDKQILLRVKFAELDRAHTNSFGVNLFSTGAGNTRATIGTGQFSSGTFASTAGTYSLTDTLSMFAFRPDINLGAAIKALQAQNLLQILAEPNLVTTTGKEASFLAGGEFPVPIVQSGATGGAITVMFREYGIKLNFTPNLTPNGTLKMHVKPEVSTIDLSNSVTVNGTTVPALSTRRVESDIELQPGQSFVIGGLVDDRVTEEFNKLPGLANIPLLGQIFKSRTEKRQKTELIVMVTPEVVEPMAAGDPRLLPQMPGGMMGPAMLPNGVPGSSNVGTGAGSVAGGKNRDSLFTKQGRKK